MKEFFHTEKLKLFPSICLPLFLSLKRENRQKGKQSVNRVGKPVISGVHVANVIVSLEGNNNSEVCSTKPKRRVLTTNVKKLFHTNHMRACLDPQSMMLKLGTRRSIILI